MLSILMVASIGGLIMGFWNIGVGITTAGTWQRFITHILFGGMFVTFWISALTGLF